MKISSGGQTGVDRAALDVALKHGIECGGWCPKGRMDEFERIPDRYPVKELPNGGFPERTLQNAIDSDATVIFSPGKIEGGTAFTVQCCRDQQRPYVIIDAQELSIDEAAKAIVSLIQGQNIERLNIAGPRASEWAGGYDHVFAVLEKVLEE
jgi:hypothetical protein